MGLFSALQASPQVNRTIVCVVAARRLVLFWTFEFEIHRRSLGQWAQLPREVCHESRYLCGVWGNVENVGDAGLGKHRRPS